MSTVTIDEVRQASFRGATFLLSGDATTEGGRKLVTHEYPNTDRRVVEDMGRQQRTFTLSGTVTTRAQLDALVKALESSGSGTLVHPFRGNFKVAAQPYQLTENVTDLGIATFRMSFIVTDEPVYPATAGAGPALIQQQVDTTLAAVQDGIAATFNATGSGVNYEAAQADLTNLAGTMSTVVVGIGTASDVISDYQRTVTAFQQGITANILNPTNLASSMVSMLSSVGLVAQDTASQVTLLSRLWEYGATAVRTAPTTFQRIQRMRNQAVVNNSVRASAIAQAYGAAVTEIFVSDLALENREKQLDAAYQSLLADTSLAGIDKNPSGLSDTVLQALYDLRAEVQTYFDSATVNAYKLATVRVAEQPASIVAFNQYGSLDHLDDFIAINAIHDVSFVSGNVQVTTP